jgi:hypothetical protein
MRKSDEIAKADVKWLSSFKKSINKKKDPISLYLRKARKYARRRKARNVVTALLAAAVVGLAAAVVFLLMK